MISMYRPTVVFVRMRRPKSKPAVPVDFRWRILLNEGASEKLLGFQSAPDEATARTVAARQFRIPEHQASRIVVRKLDPAPVIKKNSEAPSGLPGCGHKPTDGRRMDVVS